MILITDISMKEVKGDWAELSYFNNTDTFFMEHIMSYESVHGRVIVTDDGSEICLGLANHVNELLGLPFRAIDNQVKTITDLHDRVVQANRSISRLEKSQKQLKTDNKIFRHKLTNIYNMTFWQRLKFLLYKATIKGI